MMAESWTWAGDGELCPWRVLRMGQGHSYISEGVFGRAVTGNKR